MKEHPHAEVLRAIADGVPLSEFQGALHPESWHDLDLVAATDKNYGCGWITGPEKWQIRRKPQHIMVNGFKVPKPLDVMPTNGFVCCPAVVEDYFYVSGDVSYTWTKRCFERGIAHATKEAAIAHAKAMLGIDPEYFK